jgi:hypothetical protein
MGQKVYRVIQWATGFVGKAALRHFVSNPDFELVGVYVTNPDKVGMDAGEIIGSAPTGVLATDHVEQILATPADCVFYSPSRADVEALCLILRSGKNVVTSAGFFYPIDFNRADFEKLEAACRDGGTSIHGGGIHPGYVADVLPLTLARIVSRLDRIEVFEIVDLIKSGEEGLKWLAPMGFGLDAESFEKHGNLLSHTVPHFTQSMAIIVEGLGKTIQKVTTELDLGFATQDIPYPGGVVAKDAIAGQHHIWTAWVENAPLVSFHAIYTVGDRHIEPMPHGGTAHYRVIIHGDPPTELTLDTIPDKNGVWTNPGYTWTAMDGISMIPQVCAANPGIVTEFDVVTRPLPGLVRTTASR